MHASGKVALSHLQEPEADSIHCSGVVGQIIDTVAPPEDVNPKTPLFAPIFGATFGLFSVSPAYAAQYKAGTELSEGFWLTVN